MSSPWRILGLAPGSSVDDVRRAYARLLRQHRPDQDPVGFRRLRDAYEFVLRLAEAGIRGDEAEYEAEEEGDEDARGQQSSEPPADGAAGAGQADRPRGSAPTWLVTPEEAPPRPRPLAGPLGAALERARASGRAGAEARILQILARQLGARPGEFELAELAEQELGHSPGGLRRILRYSDLAGLPHQGPGLLRALLLAHLVADDLGAFWEVVRDVERAGSAAAGEPGSDAWVAFAVVAVELAALLDPGVAERLADLAFRRANPHERQQLAAFDHAMQASRQLRMRSFPEDRRNLVLALHGERIDADDPVARRAIGFAADTPGAPALATLLVERFPSAATRLEGTLRRAERKALASTRRRRYGESRQAEQPMWLRLLAAFFALVAFVGSRTCQYEMSHTQKQRSSRVLEDAMERYRSKHPELPPPTVQPAPEPDRPDEGKH